MGKFEKVKLKSRKVDIFGFLAKPKQNAKYGVVFLHGGGTANSQRYKELQRDFVKYGIASLALDFRGCGKSGGKYEDGSLENRLKDALAGVEYFMAETGISTNGLYLWGSSMGAHTACRVLSSVNAAGVVLQSAAAYGKKAEVLPLGEVFSKEIRGKNSYAKSPSFVSLRKYMGKLLVMYWANETLISKEVKQEYRDIVREKKGTYIEFAGVGHAMLNPKNDKEKMVYKIMLEMGRSFLVG